MTQSTMDWEASITQTSTRENRIGSGGETGNRLKIHPHPQKDQLDRTMEDGPRTRDDKGEQHMSSGNQQIGYAVRWKHPATGQWADEPVKDRAEADQTVQGLAAQGIEAQVVDPTKVRITASILVKDMRMDAAQRVTVTQEIDRDAWTQGMKPKQADQQLPRTIRVPGTKQWQEMDRRTCYRVGAPWHACPNCATYERVVTKEVRRPYLAATGDEVPLSQVAMHNPADLECNIS